MLQTLTARAKGTANRLFTSPVFSAQEITRMTIPFILDSISIMLIQMLITALISSAGEDSVAAVNLVNPVITLIVCMINGISAGGTVAVTQTFGSGHLHRTKEAAGHILWMIALVGTACSVLLIVFAEPILHLLYADADPHVLDKAVQYMQGSCVSLIIFTVYTGVFCVLRGLGESKKCLYLTVIINVAYLLFSILFINVLQMDIVGSTLAQIAARLFGSLCALGFLFFAKSLPIKMDWKSVFTVRRNILRTILHISTPLSIEQIFLYGGNILVTQFMVSLGTAAVATHAIANSLFSLVLSVATAAGTLAVTVVGRCIGANERQWAYDYGKRITVFSLVLLAAASLAFYPLFPLMLEHLYHTSSETAAQAMGLLWKVLLPALLFWPASNILPCVMRSASDTIFPSVLSFVTLWVVRVALGYYMTVPLGMGLDGIWITMWIEWAVKVVVLLWRYKSRRWMHALPPQET